MESLCSSEKCELPKIYLGGLDLSESGTERWATVRAKVARALGNYGGFEVIYDGIKPETRDELFGRVMPEVFMESNLINDPTLLSYDGIWIPRESDILPFKSLKVKDPASTAAVHECATNIWPNGNEIFCNNIWSYAKQMKELMQIIHRMILESLGLEHHYDSYFDLLQYSLRLSEYSVDEHNEDKAAIPPHVDPNFVSIICQDKKGLEVEAPNGEWLEARTTPNSATVLLGEVSTAWTNGVFRAPKHRVRIERNVKRHSAIFNAFPIVSKKIMIETPHELVDEKHPLLFNPFNYYDYIKFRHSDEGQNHKNVLEAYCGIKPAIFSA